MQLYIFEPHPSETYTHGAVVVVESDLGPAVLAWEQHMTANGDRVCLYQDGDPEPILDDPINYWRITHVFELAPGETRHGVIVSNWETA